MLRVATIGVSGFVLLATSLLYAPGTAQQAAAAGCHEVQANTAARQKDRQGVWYGMTLSFTVPYNSSCRDINITNLDANIDEPLVRERNCVEMRVRFFPRRGAEYTNAWREICGGGRWKQVAYGVKDGTWYQVETRGRWKSYFTIYD